MNTEWKYSGDGNYRSKFVAHERCQGKGYRLFYEMRALGGPKGRRVECDCENGSGLVELKQQLVYYWETVK